MVISWWFKGDFMESMMGLPSGIDSYTSLRKMSIDMVDLSISPWNMVTFHSYVNIYQRQSVDLLYPRSTVNFCNREKERFSPRESKPVFGGEKKPNMLVPQPPLKTRGFEEKPWYFMVESLMIWRSIPIKYPHKSAKEYSSFIPTKTSLFMMILGKLEYFTNLNSSAIKGDSSPYSTNHHLWVSVVGWGHDQIYPGDWVKHLPMDCRCFQFSV